MMAIGATGLEQTTMLVVEDSKAMSELLRMILRVIGVKNIPAVANARDAIVAVRKYHPDLIFIDLMLEEAADGLELVRTIRSLEDLPNPFVPIIVVSAYTEAKWVIASRDAGANEFLAKPISILGVASRIEEVIQRPRAFVRAGTYFGPNRRRSARTFDGDDRRETVLPVFNPTEMTDILRRK